MKSRLLVAMALGVASVFSTAATLANGAAKTAESGAVTMTVTAVGKKNTQPPPISQNDAALYEGKEKLQIVDWKRGEKLLLSVVIDDAVDNSAASQLNDIKGFINGLPPNTLVQVGYARNGTVQMAQDFTADRALAAKALRIPLGTVGAFGSPYLSLQDLLKRLPETHDRREIVLISSGIDYLRGGFGPFSPDLDPTIERAQRENVVIYSIYTPGVGHRSRSFFLVNNAQSSLSQLADETGGEAFYLGLDAPVSFKGYFDEIRQHLDNQYLLTFQPKASKKDRYERVRVTTEIPNVEFLAPSEVFVRKAE